MAEGKGQENPTKESLGTGGGAKTGARGSNSAPMPMKTANWAGLPGKTQPTNRAAGDPKSGSMGPFNHKSEGV